jgi:DNA repair protein RecN (Recombination protein N)
MLESLRVRNLAVVEDVTVAFQKGLNVITGETGAGKSILIDALGLVLGERADKSMIRTGEAQCTVEAVFHLADPVAVNRVLDELALDTCEENRLILRRTVSATGSGKNLVNDCPTTIQVFRQLGDLLVDLHGPHDHQALLKQAYQLDVLDAFAGLAAERETYAQVYREQLDLESRRHELDGDDSQVAQQVDLLRYQIAEIEEAKLTADEATTLDEDHTVVANAQLILELASQACNALSDDEPTAFSGVATAQRALDELSRLVPQGGAWLAEAQAVNVQIQELTRSIHQYVQDIEADPRRLEWLEQRKSLYEMLKRKYGGSVEAVLEHLVTSQGRLNDLESREEQILAVDRDLEKIRKALDTAARKLRTGRKKASTGLSQSITKAIQDLGFAEGAFAVDLEPCEPGPAGQDAIDFGFAPNVGETMRPLRAIASSGEISRVMLATKAVLAKHDRIPVLIFDEIDSNIGGEIGIAVGLKLRDVAQNHQVISITHLPQVAAHGMTHLAVRKDVRDGRTHTQIESLDEDTRTREIARMLGGEELTSVTIEHARQMILNV